ncbi:MAG: hypothetical protein ACKO9T_11885, partial [Nitrospira sp.]
DNAVAAYESLFTDAGISYTPSTDLLAVGSLTAAGSLTASGTATFNGNVILGVLVWQACKRERSQQSLCSL